MMKKLFPITNCIKTVELYISGLYKHYLMTYNLSFAKLFIIATDNQLFRI